MKKTRPSFFPLLLSLLVWLLQSAFSHAATTCEPWLAKLVSAQGIVEAQRVGQTVWQAAQLNDTYCAGDRIQVGERSRADLALVNQPVVRLDQRTTITLETAKEERKSLIELIRGAIYFFSRDPRDLEVTTAFLNAGVEGTEGFIQVAADRTFISILEGRVLASNPAGSLTLSTAESAIAEKGKPPVRTIVARPRDAVQWALYYPPTIHFRPEEFPPGPGWEGMVRSSIESYIKGDLRGAFEGIKGVPDMITEPRFFAYRASLLLTVGRVDEAAKDIERALSLRPNYSDAFALQSIIAVAQNEKETALTLAQKAVTADPKSASALIALSYAQQANFDLESALNSQKQAVQVAPDNALAWARLSELHLSFAELNEALEAAEKAVALDPNLSRTQTVLGFAHLTRVDTGQAREAFENAIIRDQADPLPRLGLGLARIRESDFDEGRREIEIAVSLNPDNSLMRSYLGKAYFEEKREERAGRQYEMAKQFDPRDPTPYFYDAIRKQTTNRPVEALHDMERAIELNENRAIYRSRLLLDSDLAARSAALGRIYSDLGFQQLALVEGWKSVNTDPTNFSAHRLLADSYSILPRHEIARVSELLQSQLLQPLNMTPIQPRLAESNLFLVGAAGPAVLSFNEFHPLFNRNGINLQAIGLAGENSTYAGEGVLSGIYNRAAFSLGGFHFTTDGWRRNADQRDSITNAFIQLELTPRTSIQAEYRYRDRKVGDLQQRFFPEDFFPGLLDEERRHTYRLGGRYAFSPNSVLLASFMYSRSRARVHDDEPPIPIPFLSFVNLSSPPINAFSGEAQHRFRSRHLNLTTGVGYFKTDGLVTTTLGFNFPPPPLGPGHIEVPLVRTDIGLDHVNGYLYGQLKFLNSLMFSAGLSVDSVEGDPGSVPRGGRTQVNPKFGIIWNPMIATTVRAAAFRALKRTLITDQTLEPTQVAGFNQFFDDPNLTESWRYGIGVDQKFTRNVFGGLEFSRRDLSIPMIAANRAVERDGKETLARTYIFLTPRPWFAFRTEYSFEKVENEDTALGPRRLNTHRVPIGIGFFHQSGLSSSLTATYWSQKGKFQRITPAVFGALQTGRDDFWTVDAALSYRLPNRYGLLTVGVANLFDKTFNYFDTDRGVANFNPRVIPDRFIFGRLTLALH